MVRFYGETFKTLSSDKAAQIHVDGKRYDILPNALLKFKDCSNAKEYVESMEIFAYQVLVSKSVPNDDFFRLIDE